MGLWYDNYKHGRTLTVGVLWSTGWSCKDFQPLTRLSAGENLAGDITLDALLRNGGLASCVDHETSKLKYKAY